MGTLYIVATPIGNLQDLTFRAVDILTKVEIIACEDTRHTGLLLKHIKQLPPHPNPLSQGDVMGEGKQARLAARLAATRAKRDRMTEQPTLLSYYEENELKRIPQILNSLTNGIDVALVSDAGTPTISDPGFKLVRECIREGIRVESIPGPSAVISSLVVSGLPTDKFLFLVYLPKKPGKRKNLLNELVRTFEPASLASIRRSGPSGGTSKQINPTIIFFESPHRLLESLEDLKEVLGDIHIVIARELTKIHEDVRREKISESISHFNEVAPKGEFVILFHPKTNNRVFR
jgi:16S rRNA (cytidine1402-2'-O)-methyltransferase